MKNSTIAFVLWICIIITMLLPGPSHSDDTTPQESFIRNFLRNYPRRMEKALELLPVMAGYAALHAINPVTVVVTIAAESSFKPGAHNDGKGEHGLMQVHVVCAKGYDLSDPHQQVAAGVACLAMARDACNGSLYQTISKYISGHCKPHTARTRAAVKRRVRIIEKWSK